ncbi:ADP-ribosylglycohydrolase family protein [Lutibaculum baratangense]|uniref:Putative hydrolase n=1 Tax=Lutibaculum baratangense AMV1 TaxID=631454 RepID=V4RH50_9HYPH|nr:ADP-ribosylglycohydrolase family protein [Lutibaculum baratangense]ESR25446.1 putative hydrolase [Lutibaculum baratangense AMV1]
MIGAIAGDIIGSRFEGHPSPPDGFDLFQADCGFTDDTVCTLAIAHALLEGEDFGVSLRRFVRRYPHAGYGGMFIRWAMNDDLPAYGSWGNGAPMRGSAVGWLARDEDEVLRLGAAQAAVSHDHPDAMAAAQAVALSVYLLRHGTSAEVVRNRMSSQFGYSLAPEVAFRQGGFDVSSRGTMPPALAAALSAPDWESAVRKVIVLGGDTDTLACIAGAVAEAVHGVPDDIADTARAHLTEDLVEVLERFEDRLLGQS